jgi:hypothetical protein
MNIFYLHPDPLRAARWHCDRHVVKMLLETVQLLYTAHWMLAGLDGPDLRTAPPPKTRPLERGYKSISNPKHPSALWARASKQHYMWLASLGLALALEYRHRFGDKTHSCEAHALWLFFHPPREIPDAGWRDPPKAMPDVHKVSGDAVRCYRHYYIYSKGARGLLTYTKRHTPHWTAVTL